MRQELACVLSLWIKNHKEGWRGIMFFKTHPLLQEEGAPKGEKWSLNT